MMTENLIYSFVVPAYNEEKNIINLYDRIVNLMKKINLQNEENSNWELIFINDGSRDNTANIIIELSQKDRNVKFVNLSRNFGHQRALSAGLKYARGEAIISMDCDLQDPPETIAEMIKKWKEGFDIIYARRLNFRKDNFLKKTGSQLYYRLLSKFSVVSIPRNVGDFRLVDKKVLLEINQMPEHSRYLRGMVAWTGFSHAFVDYQRPDREQGVSNYTISKLAMLGMDGMLNFSVLPLRLGLMLGILSIVTGFGLLAYQLGDFIINGAYYHLYKWLSVVMFIFMGFMFIILWLIGEYIGRIYDDVRNRPLYIVSETKNFEEK